MARNAIMRSGALKIRKMLPVTPKGFPLVALIHFIYKLFTDSAGNKKIKAAHAMKITHIKDLRVHLVADTKGDVFIG